MWNVNDRVIFTRYADSDDGSTESVTGTVISTFYEPGDAVQGVSIKADDGRIFGGVDAQDCVPAQDTSRLEANLARHLTLPVARVVVVGKDRVRVFVQPLKHFPKRTMLVDLRRTFPSSGTWAAVDENNTFAKFVAGAATGFD